MKYTQDAALKKIDHDMMNKIIFYFKTQHVIPKIIIFPEITLRDTHVGARKVHVKETSMRIYHPPTDVRIR